MPKHGYPTNKATSCFRGVGIIGDDVGVTSGTVQTQYIKIEWIPRDTPYSLAMMRLGNPASYNFHAGEV